MFYNVLGRTGRHVSRLSLGASARGSVFRPIDKNEGIRAVHAALDAGINYIDAAPAYGGTVAETVLDYSQARIRAGLQESMDRLGVDYLDIVHLHDFEYQDFSLTESAFAEGFPTLVKLKQEGLIGAVSAGTYPIADWHPAGANERKVFAQAAVYCEQQEPRWRNDIHTEPGRANCPLGWKCGTDLRTASFQHLTKQP